LKQAGTIIAQALAYSKIEKKEKFKATKKRKKILHILDCIQLLKKYEQILSGGGQYYFSFNFSCLVMRMKFGVYIVY
jgi:uncharacterized membrane protein